MRPPRAVGEGRPGWQFVRVPDEEGGEPRRYLRLKKLPVKEGGDLQASAACCEEGEGERGCFEGRCREVDGSVDSNELSNPRLIDHHRYSRQWIRGSSSRSNEFVADVLQSIRKKALKDRVMEKRTKTYTPYICIKG